MWQRLWRGNVPEYRPCTQQTDSTVNIKAVIWCSLALQTWLSSDYITFWKLQKILFPYSCVKVGSLMWTELMWRGDDKGSTANEKTTVMALKYTLQILLSWLQEQIKSQSCLTNHRSQISSIHATYCWLHTLHVCLWSFLKTMTFTECTIRPMSVCWSPSVIVVIRELIMHCNNYTPTSIHQRAAAQKPLAKGFEKWAARRSLKTKD